MATRRLILIAATALLAAAQTPKWLEPTKQEPAGTKYMTFESKAVGGRVSYLIYFPPSYATDAARRYPVIYWLHGGGGSQLTGAPFVELFDAAVRAGKAPEAIVVLVNGLAGSMYVNSVDGRQPVESMITGDLIPHIDRTHRTVATREGRLIEGFSMGGLGAAHLGFEYPELFGAVSNLSGAVLSQERFARMPGIVGPVFNGNWSHFQAHHPATVAARNAERIRGKTVIRFVVGDQDNGRGTLEANRELHALLERLKIAHDYTEVPGVKHSYQRLYEELGDAALPFFRKALIISPTAGPR